MESLDHGCEMVLRAAFQISCGTADRVEYEAMKNVVPVTREELKPILLELQSRELVRAEAHDGAVALTPRGIECAAKLPPVSEPPVMIDA